MKKKRKREKPVPRELLDLFQEAIIGMAVAQAEAMGMRGELVEIGKDGSLVSRMKS